MNPELDQVIKLIAAVIAAGSLLIGVLTFWRSTAQLEKQKAEELKTQDEEKKKRDEEIVRNWQRVAVYQEIKGYKFSNK